MRKRGGQKKPPGEARIRWKQINVRLNPALVEQLDGLDMLGGRAVRLEAGIRLLLVKLKGKDDKRTSTKA